MIKKLIEFKLGIWARLFLWRFHPRIVAITGSVGKTSTKEAIAAVLKAKFRVRQSQGNYNNEIGLPLAIIGADSAGRDIFGWIGIFWRSFLKFFSSDYPEVLVLELGADRPGDIGHLMDILGPVEVGVITHIGISHLEFFGSPADLAREKLTLIKKLPKTGEAVLNFDSPRVHEGRVQTKARVTGYGFDPDAGVQASDFRLLEVHQAWGANFKLHHAGTVVPFFLPGALGKPAAYAALAAAAVGLHFGFNLVECSEALKSYAVPAGRLRLIAGIKHTKIIDDTYNAAPSSTAAALEVLEQIAPCRKLAAIGSMAELGSESEAGHREVARKIIEAKVESVFLIGAQARVIQNELENRKYWGRTAWYDTAEAARIPIQNALLEGDTILVKGSQAARMEKIVKEIMAEPLRAPELLVRQGGRWASEK